MVAGTPVAIGICRWMGEAMMGQVMPYQFPRWINAAVYRRPGGAGTATFHLHHPQAGAKFSH